jgi:hypothetical protein
MEEGPKSNGDNRNPNGPFAEGNPGGPGRPKGSVSIVARIKAKFEEDPEYFEEWISKLLEDPSNRKAVMEQMDGKPKQSIDHTTAGKAIAGFNFISNGDHNTDNTANA